MDSFGLISNFVGRGSIGAKMYAPSGLAFEGRIVDLSLLENPAKNPTNH